MPVSSKPVSGNPLSSRQNGFSLIEVLIALIIMSVGMLGIAGLYVQSLQAGRTSMFRHQAVSLAGDVADRIRANPSAGIAYAGVGANNNCVTANMDCDVVSMAANDIWVWDLQAVNSLPNGDVVVNFDDTVAPPIYTITVSWNEPGITALSNPPSYGVSIPVNPF
jgi:type IV pilus assembly protein PilV